MGWKYLQSRRGFGLARKAIYRDATNQRVESSDCGGEAGVRWGIDGGGDRAGVARRCDRHRRPGPAPGPGVGRRRPRSPRGTWLGWRHTAGSRPGRRPTRARSLSAADPAAERWPRRRQNLPGARPGRRTGHQRSHHQPHLRPSPALPGPGQRRSHRPSAPRSLPAGAGRRR